MRFSKKESLGELIMQKQKKRNGKENVHDSLEIWNFFWEYEYFQSFSMQTF